MEIDDLRGVVLSFYVGRDLLHRTGAIERDEGHDLLEAIRLELSEQAAHPVGLQLEDPVRITTAQHLVDRRVVQGQRVDLDVLVPVVTDVVASQLDDREVPQAQEVDLQQAELFDALHVELRDDLFVLTALQGQVFVKRALADYHTGSVDAGRALEVFDLERG